MEKRTKDKPATRELEEFLARRIAEVSLADWKNTSKERRREFLKAARRAVSGLRIYESISAKRQERKEQALTARKAAGKGKAE